MAKTKQEQHFSFHEVLFFGRTMHEYIEMFNLEPNELAGLRILDCPSGPSSFTAEAARLKIKAVGCDPMYGMDADSLLELSLKHMDECIERQNRTPHLFDIEKPVVRYKQEKEIAFDHFSRDFRTGLTQGRYKAASLPELPFPDKSFDMVLSGNFLFLYSDHSEGGMLFDSPFDFEFHLNSILEFIRVCKQEIRIYPLKGPHQDKKPYLQEIMNILFKRGVKAELVAVSYRDVVDAHHMLRISMSSG
jgi:hypothetical protein